MLIIPVLSTLLTAFLVNSMDTSILDPKGASVAAGIDSICAIQSVHGVEVGGKLFCWSDNEDHIQLQEEDEARLLYLIFINVFINGSIL